MLRLAAERDELKVVADQFGAPTSAELIADVTALALYRVSINSTLPEKMSGIYHLTAAGKTSWHGYAQSILEAAMKNGYNIKVLPSQVRVIMTADYSLPATRPVNSCLNTSKLCSIFGLIMPSWADHVEQVVAEIVT